MKERESLVSIIVPAGNADCGADDDDDDEDLFTMAWSSAVAKKWEYQWSSMAGVEHTDVMRTFGTSLWFLCHRRRRVGFRKDRIRIRLFDIRFQFQQFLQIERKPTLRTVSFDQQQPTCLCSRPLIWAFQKVSLVNCWLQSAQQSCPVLVYLNIEIFHFFARFFRWEFTWLMANQFSFVFLVSSIVGVPLWHQLIVKPSKTTINRIPSGNFLLFVRDYSIQLSSSFSLLNWEQG